MFNPQPIENLNDYPDKKFACKYCLEVNHLNVGQLKDVIQTREKPIKKKLNQFEYIITPHLELIKQFYGHISLMESIILKQLIEYHSQRLDYQYYKKGLQIAGYNFFNQLDYLINKQYPASKLETKNIYNYLMTLMKIVKDIFGAISMFEEYVKFQKLLNKLVQANIILIKKNWNALFQLKNHFYVINCLLISHSLGDFMVSGSTGKTSKLVKASINNLRTYLICLWIISQ